MRNIILLSVFLWSFATVSYAAVYDKTGTVDVLRVHDGELFPNNDWFSVEGFNNAGVCGVYAGKVVLLINTEASAGNGERIFASVLLAKAEGSTVKVSVDDTHVSDTGYCYVRYISVE